MASDSYVAAANVLDAYATTVGQVRTAAGQIHGNQPDDPAKLAQVVLQLAYTQIPPLHLPVGKDAIASFREKVATMETEVSTWESLSARTKLNVLYSKAAV